jgi:hypothetical protein
VCECVNRGKQGRTIHKGPSYVLAHALILPPLCATTAAPRHLRGTGKGAGCSWLVVAVRPGHLFDTNESLTLLLMRLEVA